ncbi:hypothetical protein BG011_000404 [Mortierella polycephala]|uniref:Uncharacterized protein n=1 Tax=Mortierella polycephala TaxID=41804 RepID=A0A9P6U6R2_9FUNG|nr:hypothetical protein BG011_000404 [Mortierella polycephala]
MSHYTPQQKPYIHHHRDYTHDDHTQHHQNMSDQGGTHHHELEPMYNNSDYHQHPMDPYGTDGHQYPQHHPDTTYQSDFNQGQAHQGHFQDGGQSIPDQGQAHQSQPGHGISDQPNAQQGGGDLGHQDPSGQGGHSDQNNMYHGRPDNQDPFHHFGGGQQPAPVPQPVHVPGSDAPMLPPVITSDMRRSKLNAMRPDSTVQYLASPTHSNATVDYTLLEDVSVSGSMPPGHRPLSTATSYRTSLSSAGGGGGRGPGNTMQTWDENMQQQHQQQYGYSPRNEQAFLDQAHYQEDGSLLQHSQSYIRPSPAGMHTSSRVLPVSPRIATIPPPQLAPEVRAPQDRNSETVAAIVSTGNVSSLNTFDRRHPQLGEGQFADILSPTARDPQDQPS